MERKIPLLQRPKIFFRTEPSEEDLNKLKEALNWTNDFVKKGKYMAGTDSPTVADASLLPMISNLIGFELVDMSPYPELAAWVEKMKVAVPNYDKCNGEGLQIFMDFLKAKTAE